MRAFMLAGAPTSMRKQSGSIADIPNDLGSGLRFLRFQDLHTLGYPARQRVRIARIAGLTPMFYFSLTGGFLPPSALVTSKRLALWQVFF
jgi:hypothetical protein